MNEFERSMVFETGEFERPKFDCINIFKCIQIALITLFFPVHHSCKEKNSVKQRKMPLSGLIRSDPV